MSDEPKAARLPIGPPEMGALTNVTATPAAPAAPDEPKLQPHDEGCPALGTEERQHCDCGRYERYEHKLELYGECLRRNLSAAEGRMAELTRELSAVDNALARRPALEPFAHRWEKIQHAIRTASVVDDAMARLAAVEKDAERYRWLRDDEAWKYGFTVSVHYKNGMGQNLRGEQADKAIDAARKDRNE